jgi:hypothetical protein
MSAIKPATQSDDVPIVKISPQARDLVEAWGVRWSYTRAGLLIRHQGAKGDVERAPDGSASWTIDRSEPWCADIRDLASIEKTEELRWANGVPYWLVHRLLPNQVGLYVTVRDRELFVEPLDA